MPRSAILAFALLSILSVPTPARALHIQLDFVASVAEVDPSLGPLGVTVGATLTGTLTYDAASPATSGVPGNLGYEDSPILAGSFSVGSLSFTANPASAVNAIGVISNDSYLFSVGGVETPDIAASTAMSLEFVGGTHDDSLPTSFDLGDFSAAGVVLTVPADGVGGPLFASFTSLTVTVVPEPGAGSLLLAGLLLLARVRRARPRA